MSFAARRFAIWGSALLILAQGLAFAQDRPPDLKVDSAARLQVVDGILELFNEQYMFVPTGRWKTAQGTIVKKAVQTATDAELQESLERAQGCRQPLVGDSRGELSKQLLAQDAIHLLAFVRGLGLSIQPDGFPVVASGLLRILELVVVEAGKPLVAAGHLHIRFSCTLE